MNIEVVGVEPHGETELMIVLQLVVPAAAYLASQGSSGSGFNWVTNTGDQVVTDTGDDVVGTD